MFIEAITQNPLAVVAFFALWVEAIIQVVKGVVVAEKKVDVYLIAGIVVGVAVCLIYSVDVPQILGIESSVPFVGSVMTGIVIGRGSNFVHDLIKMIRSIFDSQ